jgi:hypothetical protein
MAILDVNKPPKIKRRRAPRDLVQIDKNSGPARYYDKMQRDIERDLSGRSNLSRIEVELVRAFCGSATRLQYLNAQLLMCDTSECDLASYSQLTSNLVRISARLGLSRRPKDVTPTLAEIVEEIEAEKCDSAEVIP